MGTFNDGDSGSSIRTKINTAIQKTEGTSAISTIDVDGGAIDGVTLGTNSAVTEAQIDNVNVNGNAISTTNTNGNLEFDPNGSGKAVFKGNSTKGAGQFVLNCEQNSHGITIKGPPHSAAASYTLTLPNTDGSANEVLKTDGSGNLDWVAQSSGISNVVDDTTPQLGGDLDTNSNSIKFGDRSSSGVNELIFGAGDDLKIFHGTNNHSQIVEGGSGNLQIYASNLQLKSNAGADYLLATDGGSVELYHNSNKKAETTSTGLTVTGTVAATAFSGDGSSLTGISASLSGNMAGDIASNGHEIKFADSGAADENRLTFGASDDLEIYHDGSNSYIVEGGTGDLRLQAANLAVQNTFGQAMLEANNGGGVNLYHNTSLKASTLSDGLSVRGQLKIQNSSGTTQYTLPAGDGSASQVLQTDGSGTISFATISGGSPDLFAESYDGSSTKPSASGSQNAVAIGVSASASSHDTIAIGESSTASATKALAIGYNSFSSGGGAGTAVGHTAYVNTGTYANAFGHNSYSTGQDAVAIGQARAQGTDSLAAVISTNSSSYGAGSAGNGIALGRNAKSTGARATAIGFESVSSGIDSHAFGRGATASSENAFAFGYKANANVLGCFAFSAGIFGAEGDAQGRQYILRADTTDATATVLTTDNGSASVFNCPRVDSDTVITFDGVVTATQNGAQAYAGWKVEGLIVSDGGTVTMAASTVTAIQNTPNWGMTVTADDSNNILKITGTGEAAHNIRWVANIRTVETTYA